MHVAHSEAVHERDARGHLVDDSNALARQLDDRAVLGDHDRARRNARITCQLRVRGEHAELAVDRHHVARTQQRDERPDLLRARVPRHVYGRDLLMQDLGAGLGELVDRIVDT